MLISNSVLNVLNIDSADFFFESKVNLYKDDDVEPYGKVSLRDGHYHITVGDLSRFDPKIN